MATLTVSADADFRNAPNSALVIGQNITDLVFTGAFTVTFGSNQFGGANMSNTLHVTGSAGSNFVNVIMSATGTFSAAGWTFTNWTGADQVNIIGTSGNNSITGSSQDDNIVAGDGADFIDAGGGDDFIGLNAGKVDAGETDQWRLRDRPVHHRSKRDSGYFRHCF